MAGNNGGPWGGGGNSGGGGNGGDDKRGNQGGGRKPGPEGPQIPEIEELMKKGQEQLRVLMGGRSDGRRPNGGPRSGGGGGMGRGVLLLGALAAAGLNHFENGCDIVFDGKTPKDRHLLWQIADPEPRTAIHGQVGDIDTVDNHMPALGLNQPGDGVKRGGFARAVGAEQRHNLATLQIERDIADNGAALVAFSQVAHLQPCLACCHGKGGSISF